MARKGHPAEPHAHVCTFGSWGMGARSPELENAGRGRSWGTSRVPPAALNTWIKQRKLCLPGSRAQVTRSRVPCSTLEFLQALLGARAPPATQTRPGTALSR